MNAMTVETSAIVRSTLGAAIVRENISIPETSVPNQWVAFGGIRLAPAGAELEMARWPARRRPAKR